MQDKPRSNFLVFRSRRHPRAATTGKGAGVFGTFTVTRDVRKYTKAKIFSEIEKKTPMFAQFSNLDGERGSGRR